jgi:hypothetical protein
MENGSKPAMKADVSNTMTFLSGLSVRICLQVP